MATTGWQNAGGKFFQEKEKQQGGGCKIDIQILLDTLKVCSRTRNLEKGKELHAEAKACGYDFNIYIATALINMYGKCGNMLDAREMFDGMKHPTVVSWTALILGYAENGQGHTALDMFARMRTDSTSAPNAVTLVAVLKACTALSMEDQWAECKDRGQEVHNIAVEYGCNSDVYVQNSLVDFYAKCGSMKDACELFDSMKHPTVVSWNVLILRYADNGQGNTALDMFTTMGRNKYPAPSSVTMVAALKACASIVETECRDWITAIYSMAVENGYNSDVYVQSTLLGMYAKCGSMMDARGIFDSMKCPDVVSWTSLILGYADNGQGHMAQDMFTRMRSEGPAPNSVTLLAALKACTSLVVRDVACWAECRDRGIEIQKLAAENGCNSDIYLQNSLIDMYTKCGSIMEAREVFNSMKNPTVVSWNVLILGYAENGQGHSALDMFTRMRTEGFAPNSLTLVAALKSCNSIFLIEDTIQREECSNSVRIIQSIASENDCNSDAYLQSTIVDMHAKCGSIVDARDVFDSMKHPDVVSWNVLILGYAENGQGRLALEIFTKMKTEGPAPNSLSLIGALKACISLSVEEGASAWVECLDKGKEIQCLAVESFCNSDPHMQSTLIDMYAKCGSMLDAHEVFDGMALPDVVCWNVLMLGYVENGQGNTALGIFNRMRSEGPAPDSVTLLAFLKVCISLTLKERSKERSKEIHNIAVQHGCNSDIYMQSTIIDMYAKCSSMMDAREVFDSMKYSDAVSWNVLILGYAENNEGHTALEMFTRMRNEGPVPDTVTFLACLKACTSLAMEDGCRDKGKGLHSIAAESGCNSDNYVQSTLVDMYAKFRSMEEASEVFDTMKHPDVVSWTALIMGYAENDKGHAALNLFSRMRSEGPAPNSVTLVAALKACISLAVKDGWMECSEWGRGIHNIAVCNGCSSDSYVQSTLVDMYAKCSDMVSAHEEFDQMQHPDVVSWTVLILGYVDDEKGQTALDLFTRMRSEGPAPDSMTLGAALKSCGLVGALDFGRKIHSELDCRKDLDAFLVNCLVDFYAKCGSLVEAQRVFDLHSETRDMITWNALLGGFSSCGDNEAVFGLFEKMQDAGFSPDSITFLCVLTCCSHTGLVAKGKECFDSMFTKYGVIPTVKHYNCMMDIYGRANKLDDARALMERMPCSPNDVSYMTILGSRKW